MKVRKGVLAASLCILLSSLMFVFMANMGPAQASDTQATGVYEEGATGSFHETSQAWAAEREEEYKEGEEQEQLREGMSESEEGEEQEQLREGMSESEEGEEGSEHESDTQESPDEESSQMPPQGDDDLAQGQGKAE